MVAFVAVLRAREGLDAARIAILRASVPLVTGISRRHSPVRDMATTNVGSRHVMNAALLGSAQDIRVSADGQASRPFRAGVDRVRFRVPTLGVPVSRRRTVVHNIACSRQPRCCWRAARARLEAAAADV